MNKTKYQPHEVMRPVNVFKYFFQVIFSSSGIQKVAPFAISYEGPNNGAYFDGE